MDDYVKKKVKYIFIQSVTMLKVNQSSNVSPPEMLNIPLSLNRT